MRPESLFKLRTKVTPEIIELLTSVSLGTNGAQYQHLDTPDRIYEIDNPLFLSIERKESVSANVTFCRREHDWYIRYFAFSNHLQSGGKIKSKATYNSFLKREINSFFESVFKGEYSDVPVHNFYAYIDPHNSRSLWMSENFGFKTVGTVRTQTFSRIKPKFSERIFKMDDEESISDLLVNSNSHKTFFFHDRLNKGPFYILKNEIGEMEACIKVTRVNWKIHRLPGKFGGFLKEIIPLIPGLNKVIRPDHHTFLVPEGIWVNENNVRKAQELFEGVLNLEGLNLMIWWTDENDVIYKELRKTMKWGILNKIVGVAPVNIVVKENPFINNEQIKSPFFISGFDFV